MMTEKRGIARRQAEFTERKDIGEKKGIQKVHRYNESMQEESINEVGSANENISAKAGI